MDEQVIVVPLYLMCGPQGLAQLSLAEAGKAYGQGADICGFVKEGDVVRPINSDEEHKIFKEAEAHRVLQ